MTSKADVLFHIVHSLGQVSDITTHMLSLARRLLFTSATSLRQKVTLPAKLTAAYDPQSPLPEIHCSDPIVDRKSRFIGHAATVKNLGDVAAVVGQLLQDKKIARATHPAIYAYRIGAETGFDDAGEAQAGTRLATMLEQRKVDNVVVVVTRWYGGVHLGADRFRRINEAGREALAAAGLI